jgi:hypothetical protein
MSGVKAFSAFLFLTSSEYFWVFLPLPPRPFLFCQKKQRLRCATNQNYGVMLSHAASLYCKRQILKSTLAEKYSQSRESKLNSQAPAHSMTVTQLFAPPSTNRISKRINILLQLRCLHQRNKSCKDLGKISPEKPRTTEMQALNHSSGSLDEVAVSRKNFLKTP